MAWISDVLLFIILVVMSSIGVEVLKIRRLLERSERSNPTERGPDDAG